MVDEVSNYYTGRTIKNFGIDWKNIVKGISEAEIRVAVYHKD
jgi:hypothetical protein